MDTAVGLVCDRRCWYDKGALTLWSRGRPDWRTPRMVYSFHACFPLPALHLADTSTLQGAAQDEGTRADAWLDGPSARAESSRLYLRRAPAGWERSPEGRTPPAHSRRHLDTLGMRRTITGALKSSCLISQRFVLAAQSRLFTHLEVKQTDHETSSYKSNEGQRGQKWVRGWISRVDYHVWERSRCLCFLWR